MTPDASLDFVTCGGGRIAMVPCPGLDGAGLRHDLARLRRWPAERLLTLLAARELTALGLDGMGRMAAAAGLAWHHLPVDDMQAPGPPFERAWTGVLPLVHRTLQNGDSVVIHCRGGLGRTGTLAACLLVHFGAMADDAMGQVRTARPGAIETAAQERYVRTFEWPETFTNSRP